MGNPPGYGYGQHSHNKDNQPMEREELVNIINNVMNQAPHRRMSRLVYKKPYPAWINQLVEIS